MGFLRLKEWVKNRSWIWWVGMPFSVVLVLFGYFAYPRILLSLDPWWRFPVATPGVFDSYLYYFWGGAVAQNLSLGEWLHWLRPGLRALWVFYGHRLSIPEFILSSQIVSAMLLVWILPWVIRQWSFVTVAQSRWLTAAFFVAWTCTYGFRPGVYSWYAPWVLLGMGFLASFMTAVEVRAWFRASLLAAAAFFLTGLYPWYQATAFVFVAVVIGLQLFSFDRRWFYGGLLVGILVAILAGVVGAPWFLEPSFRATLDQYARTGVTFTHLPFFSNTALAIMAWLSVILLAVKRYPASLQHWNRLFLVWAVTLVLWFDYPLTGLYIYNEHYMVTAAALGFLSVGAILFQGSAPVAWSKRMKVVAWAIVSVSSLALIYYTLKSILRGNVLNYLHHLVIWLPLAFASATLLFPRFRRAVVLGCFGGLFFLGIWGYATLLSQQVKDYPAAFSLVPVVDWIRADGAPHTTYCSDAQAGIALAAHTGRRFYPSEGTIHVRENDEAFFARFGAIAQIFDIRSSSQLSTWEYFATYGFFDGRALFPYQIRLFTWLGMSEARAYQLAGSDVENRQARITRLHAYIDQRLPHPPLREVCQRLVVRRSLASFWRIPPTAQLLFEDDVYRIYDTP